MKLVPTERAKCFFPIICPYVKVSRYQLKRRIHEADKYVVFSLLD
jgi:hypothetical protein